jgi:hypothetical protein
LTAEELDTSSKKIGQLYPILVDFHGNIIDGEHRFSVDKKWKKMKLRHIKTERDRIIARIVSNNVRRNVSKKEKTMLLKRLAEIYLNKGIELKKISSQIMDETGMSYQWVMKYLPNKYKQRPQKHEFLTQKNKVPRYRTIDKYSIDDIRQSPRRNGALKIKRFANTDFVSVTIERAFYEDFEEASLALGMPPEISILKALEEYYLKLKRTFLLNKPISQR